MCVCIYICNEQNAFTLRYKVYNYINFKLVISIKGNCIYFIVVLDLDNLPLEMDSVHTHTHSCFDLNYIAWAVKARIAWGSRKVFREILIDLFKSLKWCKSTWVLHHLLSILMKRQMEWLFFCNQGFKLNAPNNAQVTYFNMHLRAGDNCRQILPFHKKKRPVPLMRFTNIQQYSATIKN